MHKKAMTVAQCTEMYSTRRTEQQKQDHDYRSARASAVSIVKTTKRDGDLWVQVLDKSSRNSRTQHVIMKKKKNTGKQLVPGHQRKQVLQPPNADNFWTTRGRRTALKAAVRNPRNALEQKCTRVVPTTRYYSASCTCPDWNFRGVIHKRDRKTTRTDYKVVSNRKIPVLRAEHGCKHMLKANSECN